MLQGCAQNVNRLVLLVSHDMTAVCAEEACFSQSTAVRTSLVMQLTSDVVRLHRPRHARRWFRPAALPDCGISCSIGGSSGRDFLLSVPTGTVSLNRSESSDTSSRRLRFRPASQVILSARHYCTMLSMAGRPNICDPWFRQGCR